LANNYQIKNNPLNSRHFLKRLHHDVKEMESRYNKPEDEDQKDSEEVEVNGKKREEDGKKVKEYFGQFRKSTKAHNGQRLRLEDNFDNRTKASDAVIN